MEEDHVAQKDERQPMKFSLEDIFFIKDSVHNVEAGEFEKARDVIKRQSTQPVLAAAQCVVRHFRALIRAESFEDIPTVAQTLFDLIQEEKRITGNVVKKFAGELKDKKYFPDSFLCLLVATKCFEQGTNPNDSIVKIQECAEEIYCILKHLLESETDLEPFIMECVIPEIERIRRKIQNTESDNRKHRSLQEAFCIHIIYRCYRLCEYWDSCLVSLRHGIALIQEVFEEDASNYRIYGLFLNSLGFVQSRLSRDIEALQSFQLAIDATKKAEDYANENKKNVNVNKMMKNNDNVRQWLLTPK